MSDNIDGIIFDIKESYEDLGSEIKKIIKRVDIMDSKLSQIVEAIEGQTK